MKLYDRRRTTRGSSGPGRALRAAAALFLALVTLMTALSTIAPVAAQGEPEVGTASVEVHVAACEPGYDPSDLFTTCHGNGVTDVQVQLTSEDGALDQTMASSQPAVPGPGIAQFGALPAGAYTIDLNLPEDGGEFFTYCSLADTDDVVPMTPGNAQQGEITIADGQAVICDFYILPTAQAQPAQQPANQQAEQAQITVNPVVCPVGTEAPDGFEDLDGVCTEPVEDVTFTWGNTGGTIETINTDDADPVVIDEIEEGTYTLYSDVPLEFATEALFCVADEGNRYQKEFSENGVTTFSDIMREQIVCDWFILPLDLQGEETVTTTTTATEPLSTQDPVVTPTPDPSATEETVTPPADDDDVRGVESGASLIVHLSLCPIEYSGDALFDTCHDVGISDQPFYLTGPDGEAEDVTVVPQTPGPGMVEFTSLPAGDYTLAGGPPGDFGSVELYCTTQPDGAQVTTSVESTVAAFTIGEGDDVLCDWYYIPDSQGNETPTPTVTPEPEERAEILVTLYTCAPGTTVAGASYADLQDACSDTRDDVPFTLGDAGAPPLTANTGVSGDGAVRFYELLPADYTLQPSLPDGLSSAAVFCQLNGGAPYQKTLSNGATTFANVDGDSVTCDWYALQANPNPEPEPQGPGGSITVREYLCAEDQSEIEDWERECEAGSSGATFTVASTDGAITLNSPTNADGVAVFSQLPDGFYTLEQSEGMWCKARAERVDSQSRVIVEGGQNTDVFLYQCSEVTELPSTGTGPGISPMEDDAWWQAVSATEVALMGIGLLGAAILIGWSMSRRITF